MKLIPNFEAVRLQIHKSDLGERREDAIELANATRPGITVSSLANPSSSLIARRDPENPSIRAVGRNVNGAVRPLSHIPNTLIQIFEELLLRGHLFSVKDQPREVAACERAYEKIAAPLRSAISRIEGHAGWRDRWVPIVEGLLHAFALLRDVLPE